MPPRACSKEWHSSTQGNGNWEAVVAPIDCNYYSIDAGDDGSRNPLYFTKASDPDDATTQWTGNWWSTTPSRGASVGAGIRWKQGETITYVQSSRPVRLYFLR